MSKTLDILRYGRPSTEYDRFGEARPFAKALPRIKCADGFDLSVQAGQYLYSIPRDDVGPWVAVEVGFPSERPEPWEKWSRYVEDAETPTRTVYAYVPVALVESLIALHGGEA